MKALYGLPQAPKLWNKFYEKKLLDLGWLESEEKGLWRKPSAVCPGKLLKLGVYVDDNTATGPNWIELESEIKKVLKVFPGKWIHGEQMHGGWLRYDQLGADVWCRQSTKELKICMERYIEKLSKKFRLEKCKEVQTPNFEEHVLHDDSPVVEFPIREAVGCLSWAATVCRPDISSPTNCLARVTGNKVTKSIASAAKKVLKFLISTPRIGISYSPANEKSFNSTFQKMIDANKHDTKHKHSSIKPWNLFTDASFASDFKTLKSVSGCILYYKSCPIFWRSARQSVRTNSTFEAEFVAGSDGLIASENLTFKGFFEEEFEDPDLWIDNATAVQVSQQPTDEQRPRSRHVALRYHRVKDYCDKIRFCPTQHMKADSLTKIGVSQEIRDNIFHHNPNMINVRKVKVENGTDSDIYFVLGFSEPSADLEWLQSCSA